MKKGLVILRALLFLGGFISSSLFAQQALTISYDQIITSPRGEVMTSKVWIKGDNMRIEQVSEEGKMVYLMKEGVMYLYYPAQKIAMKMDVSAGADQEEQENPKEMVEYLKSIEAKPLGQERIEGKLCDVYQITHPQTGAEVKIWVWRDKNFPLKSVMTVDGETITTEYRNVQMGIDIPNSYFELPPGTQIMDMSQMMPGFPQE